MLYRMIGTTESSFPRTLSSWPTGGLSITMNDTTPIHSLYLPYRPSPFIYSPIPLPISLVHHLTTVQTRAFPQLPHPLPISRRLSRRSRPPNARPPNLRRRPSHLRGHPRRGTISIPGPLAPSLGLRYRISQRCDGEGHPC